MNTRPTPALFAMAIALASVISVHSAGLDDLLDDKGSSASLAETDKFQATWDRLLGELSRREYAKADVALRTLESEKGFVSPRRRDFIRLSGRVVRFKESLESDKAAFRDAFKNVGEGVAELEREAKALELQYNLMIRKGGMTNEIKKSMDKKWNDKQAEVAMRRKLQDSMKVEAQNFEGTRVEKLETEIAEWISKDDTEEDVVTGLVLSTAYLDQVGDSEKVRALSQNLSGKQSELEKAGKIVAAIVAEIEPLAAAGKGDEAKSRLDAMIAKVDTSNQSKFVRNSAVKKLRALDIRVSSARTNESRHQAAASMNAAEISARLVELEGKLEKAQENFGTVIRSIEGFSEFTGEFKAESDREKTAAKLKEKIKTGAISKDKVDNLIKAKSEHVGILREVEVLQSDPAALTVVQKGRLANLQATAGTAMELLRGAAP